MLRSYLTIALRNLRSQRSYTLLNSIGLSVGLAGAWLLFLFVRHHYSTDRHHAHFDRIFRVGTDLYLEDGTIEYNPESAMPLAQVMRTEYPQVEQAAYLRTNREVTVGVRQPGQAEPVRFLEHTGTGFVEAQWFDVLTYTWLQGDAKTALAAPNRAVLTQSWARKYFGDANPMGQTVTLDNKTNATVAGVVADPLGPTDTDLGLFISMGTLRQFDPEYDPTNWWQLNSTNRLYVRLRDPNGAESIAATFPALSKKHYADAAHIFRFNIQPLRDLHFDIARDPTTAIRASLLWSLVAIGILLVLAACINFVNLATAQVLRRGKEVGIRKTLGSTRGQLVKQFLLETALIVSGAGVLAGLWVAVALPFFANWVHVDLGLRPDVQLVGGGVGMLMAVWLLAGAYPALVLSGVSPQRALRGHWMRSPVRGVTVRQGLIVAQFVVCQALLVGALVVAHQMRFIQQADLGFVRDNVVMVRIPDKVKSTQEAFRQRLTEYPGIASVSFEHRSPASNLNFGGSVKFNGNPDWTKFPVRERLADAHYLDTYGLKLLAGRNIQPSDSIREYVINETLLHILGFREPQQIIGKTLQYHLSPVFLPIVGVVKDFHQKSFHEAIGPCIIASYSNRYAQAGIRLTGTDQPAQLGRIREIWQSLYPNEVFEYAFVNDEVAQFYETETLTAQLMNVFTAIAILICCLGLYGLVSHAVGQRTKEIGIRKVLGASVASIVGLLSANFLKLVLVALVVASPLAWFAMSRWLQGFAYKVDIAWWMFALAGLLAVTIALLTVSFQTVKAALANPVKSLRSE